MKRWLTLIGIVVVLVLVLGGLKGFGIYKMVQGFKAQGAPKATVSTQKIGTEEWTTSVKAVGSLRAVRGVDLASEVGGVVTHVALVSGSNVGAGDTLVQLLSDTDLAQLASLKSQAALALVNANRSKAQFEAGVGSRAQYDTDAATLNTANATARQQQAVIAKKTIRAPFAGQVGISSINPGHYLQPGEKIVTLQQLDTLYVDFFLPQSALPLLAKGGKVVATSDSAPGVKFAGEISAVEPLVDTDTRNVKVQATLRNPDHKLLPGMFANVDLTTGSPQQLLTLPQTAIAFNPYGETVYVVVPPDQLPPVQGQASADGKKADAKPAEAATAPAANGAPALVAKQVFVTTGAKRGDQIAILAGLKAGDEVVTTGQLKLKNGMGVIVNNDVKPTNDAAPKPVDQ